MDVDHRALGVSLDNQTWAALDAGRIDAGSPARDCDALLYAAYAPAYHWMRAGTSINHARAEHLVSRVALRVGLHGLALHHARRCLGIVEAHPDLAEDWDAGFAHEALARALSASGDRDAAIRHLEEAADDREVLEAEIGRGEWLGLFDCPPAWGGTCGRARRRLEVRGTLRSVQYAARRRTAVSMVAEEGR